MGLGRHRRGDQGPPEAEIAIPAQAPHGCCPVPGLTSAPPSWAVCLEAPGMGVEDGSKSSGDPVQPL